MTGASTQGGMVREAPWRLVTLSTYRHYINECIYLSMAKIGGGECCDDNDANLFVSIIIHYYMNTFITYFTPVHF